MKIEARVQTSAYEDPHNEQHFIELFVQNITC